MSEVEKLKELLSGCCGKEDCKNHGCVGCWLRRADEPLEQMKFSLCQLCDKICFYKKDK